MKPFQEWLKKKMTVREFESLSLGNKEKLFFQWKHGFINHDTNDAVEKTDRFLYGRYKDMEKLGWGNVRAEAKEFYKRRIAFAERCMEIWKTIEDGMLVEY